MADVKVAQPGLNGVPGAGNTDTLANYLKIFAGETITAFERQAVTMGRHLIRTIDAGKSAQFPVFGRAKAAYLKPGKSLDDIRENILHDEKIIQIDGLLTSSQMITDIDEAMRHYEVRSEYSKQMGEALAVSADAAVLAEVAKMVVANKENIPGLGKGKIVTRAIAASDIGVTENMGKAIVQILLEIKVAMSKNRVPNSERFAFVTPEAKVALVSSLVAINRDYGAVATILEGDVMRIAGFDIIECPHMTDGGVDNANVLQGDGHIFPAAYVNTCHVIAMHRTAVGTVKLKDLALEQARRAEYQADMLVAKFAMGHGALRPEAAFLGTVTAAG